MRIGLDRFICTTLTENQLIVNGHGFSVATYNTFERDIHQ